MTSSAHHLRCLALVLVVFCWIASTSAAAQAGSSQTSRLGWVHAAVGAEASNQDDPGYGLYRDGYRLVLDERWEEALHVFEELQRRFPASEYRDDAAYWSAYSLKYLRPRAALDAYRSFIEQYRQSSYLDDAVADLQEVEVAPWQNMNTGDAESLRTVVIAPGLLRLERELRKASRTYRRLGVPMVIRVDESLDAETLLRMEALYAIGETAKDAQAFRTLRGVAVSRKEPLPLREAALEALTAFPEREVLPVVLEIARDDTSRAMQSYAVELIAESPADTGTKIDLLIDLYRTLPHSRREQRRTIFYTIADFGTEHAVDFLGEVALTSADFETRREAVYYLGSIGGPNARSLLMKILLEK